MNENLTCIYSFLKENHWVNAFVQKRTYAKAMQGGSNPKEKIIGLLYEISRQQPAPRLNTLGTFFEYLNAANACDFSTKDSFVNFLKKYEGKKQINPHCPIDYEIFGTLANINGFGEKTAALLTKSIYEIQTKSDFKIWDKQEEIGDSVLFLPVDSVIKHIFKTHLDINGLPTFKIINQLIRNVWKTPDELLIWDDLWFWGFITQMTENGQRITTLNMAKYWALELPLDINRGEHAKKTEELAKKFINHLENLDFSTKSNAQNS